MEKRLLTFLTTVSGAARASGTLARGTDGSFLHLAPKARPERKAPMNAKLIFFLLIAALLMVSISAVQANPEAYDLSWWKVAGGGGNSQGGSYLLQGTAGQTEAGTIIGGQYALVEGFWSVTQTTGIKIFLPCITR
jgi:hypothetical protein